MLRARRPRRHSKSPDLFKAYLKKYWAFKQAFHSAFQHARAQVVASVSPVEMVFLLGGIPPLSVVGLSELPESVQRE